MDSGKDSSECSVGDVWLLTSYSFLTINGYNNSSVDLPPLCSQSRTSL